MIGRMTIVPQSSETTNRRCLLFVRRLFVPPSPRRGGGPGVRGNLRRETQVFNDPPHPTLPRAGGREKPAPLAKSGEVTGKCRTRHTATDRHWDYLGRLAWWARPALAIALVWMFVGIGPAGAAGNPDDARKRIQVIDAELKQVEQGMTDSVRQLRENNSLLETASDQLEKEDAGFRQLKQELKDLEKRVDEVKKEMDRRVAAVDRFAGYYAAYHQALVRIESLRLQERRLSAERSVLLSRIDKKE